LTIKEIGEELKSILQGKTIDAILPPFIYVIVNGIFGLGIAAGSLLALQSFPAARPTIICPSYLPASD